MKTWKAREEGESLDKGHLPNDPWQQFQFSAFNSKILYHNIIIRGKQR